MNISKNSSMNAEYEIDTTKERATLTTTNLGKKLSTTSSRLMNKQKKSGGRPYAELTQEGADAWKVVNKALKGTKTAPVQPLKVPSSI